MPKGERTPDEVTVVAVELYAQGYSTPKVAKLLNMPVDTVKNWKARNWPENWAKKRQKRLEDAAQKLEKESLETLTKSAIKQQKMYQGIQIRLANRVIRADDNEIAVVDACREYRKAVEGERELFMEPDEVLKIKNKSHSMNIAAGAVASSSDTQNAMVFLEDSFKKIHDKRFKKEVDPDEDPATGS